MDRGRLKIKLLLPDDASASSTSKSLGSTFNISFGDTSAYNGIFYKDTANISGTILEGLQFAVIDTTENLVISTLGTDAVGLMGVGLEVNEAEYPTNQTYPNIVAALYNAHKISAKAFSLYLNKTGTSTPNLFHSLCWLRFPRFPLRTHHLRRRRQLFVHWAPY